LRRGEVWTVAGGADHASKPRPAVVVHDNLFADMTSVTLVTITSDLVDSPLIRLNVVPNGQNGLLKPSQMMVDKITTVPRSKLGKKMGRLSTEDEIRLNRALVIYLGLAGQKQV
jgi:mRNA interferase MazF